MYPETKNHTAVLSYSYKAQSERPRGVPYIVAAPARPLRGRAGAAPAPAALRVFYSCMIF